jgi:hypothetical protein
MSDWEEDDGPDAETLQWAREVIASEECQSMLHDVALEGTIPLSDPRFLSFPYELDRQTQQWVIPLPFFMVK